MNEFIFMFLLLFMGQYYRDIDISQRNKLFSTILLNQNNQSINSVNNNHHNHHEWLNHILQNNPILLSFLSSSSSSRPRNFMGIRMVKAGHPTKAPTESPTQGTYRYHLYLLYDKYIYCFCVGYLELKKTN